VKNEAVAEGATVAYIVDIESEYGDKGEEHVSAMDPQDAIRKVKAKFKNGEYAVWPTGVRRAEAVDEEKTRLDPKCWTGKKIGNPKTKMKGGVRVNNCVPAEESYMESVKRQGITDIKLLEAAAKIDLFAKTIK
jgi:hypothetical protein